MSTNGTVIKVENLSKLYRLGQVGTGTVSHDLNRWLAKIRGKEDPFALVGQVNDRTQKADSDYVWSLKNINFEVKQGEVLGIIGKNGAGKSTLLKLLSQITSPTTGTIKVKGRIAALLEVGTGMHQEMTARENIYLNGAILGMQKSEIKTKFDEIIDFSGCALYVDTPIKRFSSGMRVRLGFAVAAFLEPEILIVDEVLAVGDVEFQKKAIGKMQDVSRDGGRTVLFVSHNMAAVKNLCTRGILLDKGQSVFSGNINEVVDEYLKNGDMAQEGIGKIAWELEKAPGEEEVNLVSIKLFNETNEIANTFLTSKPIKIEIFYRVKKEISGARLIMQLIDNNHSVILTSTNHDVDSGTKAPGVYKTICNLPPNLLNKGRHNVFIQMGIPGVKVLVPGRNFLYFDTVLMDNNGSIYPENWPGAVAPKLLWETIKE